MMFKRLLKSNFFKRSVIIITLTAVFTAVFSIFIVGFSAEVIVDGEDIYLSYDLDSESLITLFQDSSPNIRLLKVPGDTDSVFSYSLNYSSSSLANSSTPSSFPANIALDTFSVNSFYSPHVYFISKASGSNEFAMNFSFDFPVNYYVKQGSTLSFYVLLPGYYYTNTSPAVYPPTYRTNVYFLDSESNIEQNVSASLSRVFLFQSINHMKSNNSYFSSGYKSFINSLPTNSYNASRFYTKTLTSNGTSLLTQSYQSSIFNILYKIDITFNDSMSDVSTLYFNILANDVDSSSSYEKFFIPYFSIETDNFTVYEKTTSDIANLMYMNELVESQKRIEQKLDNIDNTISGEMPSEAAQELESQSQQQAQLQSDIQDIEDKFTDFEDDIEWNRSYPEVDQENVQPVYSSAVTNFFSFLYDPTELIPRLIAFGSSMLILFTVFKRF